MSDLQQVKPAIRGCVHVVVAVDCVSDGPSFYWICHETETCSQSALGHLVLAFQGV